MAGVGTVAVSDCWVTTTDRRERFRESSTQDCLRKEKNMCKASPASEKDQPRVADRMSTIRINRRRPVACRKSVADC